MEENKNNMSLRTWGQYLGGGFILAAALWKLADLVKVKIVGSGSSGLHPWAQMYYHPQESALLNYIFLSVGLALAGIAAYVFASRARTVGAAVPAPPVKAIRLIAMLGLGVAFFSVGIEPVRLIIGPPPLFNEYPKLFSTTILDSGAYDNKQFLGDTQVISKVIGERLPSPGNLLALGKMDEAGLKSLAASVSASGRGGDAKDLGLLRTFAEANYLEYRHQIMGRGQINHIGHILNPVNESDLGKPLRDIYMQYGLGNTLLFKLTMQALGGVSIQNYYKCYSYYLLYYLLFLVMLVYVFPDPVYAFCGFSAVAFTHFSFNYISFVLAPGIIPTIHFMDASVLLALAVFFRAQGSGWAFSASALMVAGSIFLNRQFGGMLAIAWIAAVGVYSLENCGGLRRAGYFIGPLLISAILIWGTGGSAVSGAEGMFKSYFLGFFSWQPKAVIVVFTIIYLGLSYLFLLMIKENRSAAKYLYVFSFAYAQGLFVYFYWSGLVNHLPVVFPFIAVQMLLAGLLIERNEVEALRISGDAACKIKLAGGAISVFLVVGSLMYFYHSSSGKRQFWDNFKFHKTYEWTFPRARLISTINPDMFAEAVELIHKYSTAKGIAIISKYDNLLPFLSGRYSLMPHFELPWYIVSDAKAEEVSKTLRTLSPEYLFVDSDIAAADSDPWAAVYSSPLIRNERFASNGRLIGLQAIFNKEADKYALTESGRLISVYRKVH